MRDAHPITGSDVVVDGWRLHVVGHGRGSGSPLLLLHGLTTSSYLWRDVMRDLERDVRTIAPDLLGLGRSERPRVADFALSAQARRLLTLLDGYGVERVIVAGHGLGGAVAVHLTALAPTRVAGLALLGTVVHPDAWTEPRRDRRLARSVPAGATLAAWRVVTAGPPPTLLLWGDADRTTSAAYGRRLADELPAATLVALPGRGHLLPEECPQRVAEELAGFRAEVGQAA